MGGKREKNTRRITVSKIIEFTGDSVVGSKHSPKGGIGVEGCGCL